MDAKRAMIAALVLLSLAPALCTAQQPTVEQQQATMEHLIWNDELPLIAAIVTIALLIIALAYMASQALMRREWEEWSRATAFQLGMSLCVLVLINILLLSCSWLSHELVGQDLYVASGSYLNTLVFYDGFGLVQTLTVESLANQLQAVNFKFTSDPVMGGIGEATLAGEKTKANAQDMLVNIIMPLIASLYAQQIVLRAAADFAVPLLIPLAFAIRFFPQTRSSADQMLAIAVGFGAIMPLTYVFNKYIANGIDMASLLAGEAAADPDIYLAQVSSLIPQAVFLPNLTIVITVTFIMAFSKLLVRGFEPEAPYGE